MKGDRGEDVDQTFGKSDDQKVGAATLCEERLRETKAAAWLSLKRTRTPMKGVSIIHDETKKKRYLQIDMDLISSKRGEIDDYLDLLLIEERKDEPTVPFEMVEKLLSSRQ